MSRRIQIVLATLVGTALLGSSIAAQRGREGGQPGGRQGGGAANGEQPLGRGAYQPTLWWGDDMFPKWPYPAGDAVYTDLDGMKIKGDINEMTAISCKSRDDGTQYWGRLTGSRYDTMTTVRGAA